MARYGSRGWGGIRVAGCGRWSGVGNWQKAVIMLVGVLSVVFGILLMYFGLKMWWQLSSDASEATQYLVQRLNKANTQLDLVRVKWEHEIVRQQCSAEREPCECGLVSGNRRAYRTVIVISLIIFIVGVIGLCGSCCENHTTLLLFALLAGSVAVVEFCVSMVLFSSHHQLTAVTPHVLEVMRKPMPPSSQVHSLTLSDDEEEAFHRAMGWLDEMGTLDTRRVEAHYFSWADQFQELYSSAKRKALHIMVGKDAERLLSDADSGGPDPGSAPADFEPLCSRGVSSLRRRSLADIMIGIGHSAQGQINSAISDMKADFSAEDKWRALTPKFDYIWNLQNISLSERAYEIAVHQECLYTIKIRILQELKEVKDLQPTLLRNALITFFGCVLHVLAAVAAHLLVRVLRNHFEAMIAHQRDAARDDVTVVTTNNTSTTNNQQNCQQQQQQQMMMMMPITQSCYQQPYQQSYQQPYQQSYQQPGQQPNQQPYQQPNQQPYQQPNQQPYQQPNQQPCQQPNQQPNQQSNHHSYQQPCQQSGQQTNQQSDQQPYQQPNQQPNQHPCQQPQQISAPEAFSGSVLPNQKRQIGCLATGAGDFAEPLAPRAPTIVAAPATPTGTEQTRTEKRDFNPFREHCSPAATPELARPHTPVYREPPPPYQLVAPPGAAQTSDIWSPGHLPPAAERAGDAADHAGGDRPHHHQT